jgi:hypothetical protein
MHPRAIVEGFEVEVTATGLVLRHRQREALQLSGVAAAVWRHADGLLSVDELAVLVGAEVDAVWLALDELADAELVVARVAPPAASRGMSRRDVLSMAAGGAVTAGLAPVVSAATTDATQAKKEQEKKLPADESAAQKEQRVKDRALQSPSAQEAEAKVAVKQEQEQKASAQRKEQDVKVSAQQQERSQKRELAQEQEFKASAASRQEREVKLSSAREQEEKVSAQRRQEQEAKVGAQRQEQTQKAAKKPAQE